MTEPAAEQLGWTACGVDLSGPSAARARVLGLDVHAGSLPDLHLPDGSFDAATMIEVLDHLEDPLGMLREIHRLLRPGESIYLTCVKP